MEAMMGLMEDSCHCSKSGDRSKSADRKSEIGDPAEEDQDEAEVLEKTEDTALPTDKRMQMVNKELERLKVKQPSGNRRRLLRRYPPLQMTMLRIRRPLSTRFWTSSSAVGTTKDVRPPFLRSSRGCSGATSASRWRTMRWSGLSRLRRQRCTICSESCCILMILWAMESLRRSGKRPRLHSAPAGFHTGLGSGSSGFGGRHQRKGEGRVGSVEDVLDC